MAAASSRREPRSERGGGRGGGGGCCSSAGSPRTTRTRHWPTTLDLASSLLFPASLMHYTRLSGLRPCTSPLLSCLLFLLPHRTDSPPPLFRSYSPLLATSTPIRLSFYIYIYMYKSKVKVHLPPSISLHLPSLPALLQVEEEKHA